MKLFPNAAREPVVFNLPDADVRYYPEFFGREKADELFSVLRRDTQWQQDEMTVFGKTHPQPRLTAFYGKEGRPYSYSGIAMYPHAWTSPLIFIKDEIQEVCPAPFTSVLLNLYRDGKDSNGWHADNEKELGRDPVIASVSLGAGRWFQLRHNAKRECRQKIFLEHGSLLIMAGATQRFWKHQIPKTATDIGERINLTFRMVNDAHPSSRTS